MSMIRFFNPGSVKVAYAGAYGVRAFAINTGKRWRIYWRSGQVQSGVHRLPTRDELKWQDIEDWRDMSVERGF